MKSVKSIITECRAELRQIGSYLDSLSSLDGARNPRDSHEEAIGALNHADLISANLRGLIIRYRRQLERKGKEA
jgi:hypothetical protein